MLEKVWTVRANTPNRPYETLLYALSGTSAVTVIFGFEYDRFTDVRYRLIAIIRAFEAQSKRSSPWAELRSLL